MPIIFDTHFHLYEEDDEQAIIQRANDVGVKYLLNIGVDLQSSQEAFARTARYDGVFASCGVHPCNIKNYAADIAPFEDLAQEENIKAIGEIGLDYYYTKENKEEQKNIFRQFLSLAKRVKKPAIIHCRDAFDDCYKILAEEMAGNYPFIIHCYTGDSSWAKKIVDIGGYISYSGICTFKNAKDIQESVSVVELKRILIETDAPYLAPTPYRGKRNEPAYIVHTLEKVAQLLDLPVDEVATLTTSNAKKLFGIG